MAEQLPEKIRKQVEAGHILLDGMIRFVDPARLLPVLQAGYAYANGAVPFAVTAFGDILTWERGQYIYKLSFRQKRADALASGADYFFDDLQDEEYAAEHFELPLFYAAKQTLGELSESECYAPVPLEILGGSLCIEHLKKVKYLEYLHLILQAGGTISST